MFPYSIIKEQGEANTPKNGQWWMCKSKDTHRVCPMIKVDGGWGSICNADGKPLSAFIQREPILEPLYKMSKAR
ncbi:hypothetical protein [Neptunomonas phycophila]|uniref:hypothetical protein n=1 Tax=Neptunomonas phycophila TaxID=1572645 RepID=UPI00373657D7